MKTVYVCTECGKIHEKIGNGDECDCGSHTFTSKNTPNNLPEKQNGLPKKTNNENLISVKMEFLIDKEKISSLLNELIKESRTKIIINNYEGKEIKEL